MQLVILLIALGSFHYADAKCCMPDKITFNQTHFIVEAKLRVKNTFPQPNYTVDHGHGKMKFEKVNGATKVIIQQVFFSSPNEMVESHIEDKVTHNYVFVNKKGIICNDSKWASEHQHSEEAKGILHTGCIDDSYLPDDSVSLISVTTASLKEYPVYARKYNNSHSIYYEHVTVKTLPDGVCIPVQIQITERSLVNGDLTYMLTKNYEADVDVKEKTSMDACPPGIGGSPSK